MPPSALEVAMQTMASVLSDNLEEKNGAPVITKDGLKQLVEQQFPHCKKNLGMKHILTIARKSSSCLTVFELLPVDSQ
ncbi:UNVERIFIED_CONTAM: hypothetical protein K2H54_022363 [Gekko kuhli]